MLPSGPTKRISLSHCGAKNEHSLFIKEQIYTHLFSILRREQDPFGFGKTENAENENRWLSPLHVRRDAPINDAPARQT
jgi:hypothetical protein